MNEDYIGTNKPKNTFSLNKMIPRLNSNVEPIVGWVEDTLGDFLKNHDPSPIRQKLKSFFLISSGSIKERESKIHAGFLI